MATRNDERIKDEDLRIKKVIDEAMTEWEKSKDRKKTKKVVKKTPILGRNGESTGQDSITTTVEQVDLDVNTSCLDIVLKASHQLRLLYGMDKPK